MAGILPLASWQPGSAPPPPAGPATATAVESIRVSDCLSFWHMIANAAH